MYLNSLRETLDIKTELKYKTRGGLNDAKQWEQKKFIK